jgi:putative tryptophan/tyrosine transport system substrate-binding protein
VDLCGSEKNSLKKMESSGKNGKESRLRPHPLLAQVASMLVWLLFYLWVFVWLLASQTAWAKRVAIFDYDKRARFPAALGRHIEKQLETLADDITVRHYTAQGNEARAVKILSDLDREGLDLIILITSDALIIAQHTLLKTPALYTNVNNPKILGFQTLGPPGGNISGVSYYIPVEKHLSVYKAIMPDLHQLGFLFDRHNQSRKAEVPEARTACVDLGLIFDSEFVERSDQLRQAVARLITRGADAIVAASSDVIYDYISGFLDITDAAGIPVFSFYKAGVSEGAVAALSSDYFQMAANCLMPMVSKVLLEKVSPGDLPVAFLKQKKLFLNTCQAKKLGLEIPLEGLIDIHEIEIEEICR